MYTHVNIRRFTTARQPSNAPCNTPARATGTKANCGQQTKSADKFNTKSCKIGKKNQKVNKCELLLECAIHSQVHMYVYMLVRMRFPNKQYSYNI